eukprot:TRINITY_DN11574_c0_g1_i2.p1 TRINITY_DN11574_c0_g1~~TRINITY_DN11574_c0_g1_i2.p1  ORF type:complete len:348 (+),score=61.60 TRINITY_DN11574_c0_g1_i2:84-1127(+)
MLAIWHQPYLRLKRALMLRHLWRLPGWVWATVENPSEANIVFTSAQIDEEGLDATGGRVDLRVNQFPFEACLVMKHHLAETVRKTLGQPAWIQPTYNLATQLAPLIGDFLLREEKLQEGGRQLWIVKPWNMARSLDSSVADTLPQLIRMVETGPKVAQKYIEKPALFQGRKFDLRFLVMLRTLEPLDAWMHQVFWARIANHQYSTHPSTLTDFQTHFTVMNYVGTLHHVPTHEFVRSFEEEHHVEWSAIEERIRAMLRQLFSAAAALHPEMRSKRARAIYGVDVMLTEDMQPKLLEVTYSPDCTRAYTYDMEAVSGPEKGHVLRKEDFYNTVFGCLYLNKKDSVLPL